VPTVPATAKPVLAKLPHGKPSPKKPEAAAPAAPVDPTTGFGSRK
jgi:hypothetical protein